MSQGATDHLRYERGHAVNLYEHFPHPHVERRAQQGPVLVADQHATGSAVARFNTRFALLITRAVGSMWCAYLFAAFDLISLPAAIKGGASTLVAWVAQTFLQLVLLAVIMVGQNVQSAAADKRSEATWHDASAALHETTQIQEHLAAQDAELLKQTDALSAILAQHGPPAADRQKGAT